MNLCFQLQQEGHVSYFDYLEARLDYITGTPCANCESQPAEPEGLFCSPECEEAWDDEDGYAE